MYYISPLIFNGTTVYGPPPKSTSTTKQIREAGAAVHACAHLVLGDRTSRNISLINGGIATIYGVLWWALLMVRRSRTTGRSGRSMSTLTLSRQMVHSESLYVECHEIWTKIFHRLDNHPVCVKVTWRSNGWMCLPSGMSLDIDGGGGRKNETKQHAGPLVVVMLWGFEERGLCIAWPSSSQEVPWNTHWYWDTALLLHYECHRMERSTCLNFQTQSRRNTPTCGMQ